MLLSLRVFVILFGLSCLAAWFQRWKQRQACRANTKPQQPSNHISPLPDFDLASTNPHPYQPWSSGKFTMTMGIRRTPQEEWLTLDNRYVPEQTLRQELLDNHREGVMQTLPGSESACEEVLEMVVSFLTQRYPHLFYHPEGKTDYIYNVATGRSFRITAPYEVPPLQVAAQLIMEDINILYKGHGDDPQQHYLVASYSMAPAGWYLQERIGWPLYKIHFPVPMWKDKLKKPVESHLLKMRASDLISRHNFFVQTNDVFFQQEPFLDKLPTLPKVEQIRIRHERQTLRRLPRTGAILFLVRTYLTPLTDLEDDPESVKAFLDSVRAMPPEMAKYKARQVWGPVVEQWCEEVLEKRSKNES